jgi:hypothetical protein
MNRIEEPLACSYEDAALNHLRDGVRATVEQRWNWLREAMESAVANARRRAARGQVTLGPDGSVWWSPGHERDWRCQAGGESPPEAGGSPQR